MKLLGSVLQWLIFGFISNVFTQILNDSDDEVEESCRCGATSFSANDLRGEIKSSNHPGEYCNDQTCTWIIKPGGPDTGIRLHFETFASENSADYLDVFYIQDTSIQKLQRLTGDIDGPELPSFVISDGGLELVFRTDGSVVQSGFFATFSRFNISEEQCVCPSILYEATTRPTVITSPNYPRPYCHNIHCFYFIEAPAPLSVELIVDDLELEGRYDSLLVFDGNDTTSESKSLLKKFTGKLNETVMLESYTQKMTLIFKADADTSKKGFRARFRKVKGPCSCPPISMLRGNSGGNFSSPGFPHSYCANLNCTYKIHVPENFKAQVTFTTFDMFYRDAVSVASEDGGFEYPLVKYSSSQAPFKFTSDSNEINLQLITADHISTEILGFNATWTAIPKNAACLCPSPNPKNMTQREGTISMTDCGPLDCEWLLSPPDDNSKALSVWVDSVLLDQRHSWLRIVNGIFHSNLTAPSIIRQYTGTSRNNSEVSISRSNDADPDRWHTRLVTIHFHSENIARNIPQSGFSLRYKWHVQVCDCGQTTFRASPIPRALNSPGYPAPYCDDLECNYRITAPPGNRVVITLRDLRTEGTIDNLKIFDGAFSPATSRGTPIVTLGGDMEDLEQTEFRSNESIATLSFHTDLSVVYRGWNLTFYSEPMPANTTQVPTSASRTCPPVLPCVCPTTKWYVAPTTPVPAQRTTQQQTQRIPITTQRSPETEAMKSRVESAGHRFSGFAFAIGILVGLLLSTLILTGLVMFRKMGYCSGLPELPAVRFKKEPQHTFFSNEAYQPYAEANGQSTSP